MKYLMLLLAFSFSVMADTTFIKGKVNINEMPVCDNLQTFETLVSIARSGKSELIRPWVSEPQTGCNFAEVGTSYLLLEDNSNMSFSGDPVYYMFTELDGNTTRGYTDTSFMKANVNGSK